MIWVLLACSIILAWIDFQVVHKFIAESRNRWRWISVLWTIDALPFIQTAFSFLFMRDNPTWIGVVSLWVVWLYILLAISRLPFMLAMLFCRRMWVRISGLGVTLALMALFVYGMAVTRTDYEVRRVVVESAKLPKSFDRYKILQISDLHIGTMINPQQELNEIFDICNSLDADLVAFTGDLVDIRYSEITSPIAKALAELKSRDGIYSVLGNHDIGAYIQDTVSLSAQMNTSRLIAEQERLGWQVLDGKTEYIRRGADSIAITGISFTPELQEHRHSSSLPKVDVAAAYGKCSDRMFNVTLSHIPQLWDVVIDQGFADLTLSGHVHSMQLKIPIGRRGLSPSRLKYRRWSGLYEEDGRYLYINDGLGCVMYPMRIGVRPEITLFELRCE